MNPISFNLAKIEWDYFGTLTFRKVPDRAIRKKCIFHYLRLVSRAYGSNNWKWHTKWAVRHEFGEMCGRPHFHFLLKVPDDEVWNNKTAATKFLEYLWEKDVAGSCGYADVRHYDPNQSGAEYIMKADQGWFTTKANHYEMQKFYFEHMSALDLPLLIAPSVLWELSKRHTRGSRKERNNSEGLAQFLRDLKAGKDKSIKPSARIAAPHRFVHPADPLQY